jgi:hypothetical protein
MGCEQAIERRPDKGLGQLFANEVADPIRLAQKAEQRALPLKSDDFHLVPQLVPIETTCRGDHDAIVAPPLQFVSEPAATVVAVELFKLEEVGADGEDGGSPVNQGKRNTSFRSQ